MSLKSSETDSSFTIASAPARIETATTSNSNKSAKSRKAKSCRKTLVITHVKAEKRHVGFQVPDSPISLFSSMSDDNCSAVSIVHPYQYILRTATKTQLQPPLSEKSSLLLRTPDSPAPVHNAIVHVATSNDDDDIYHLLTPTVKKWIENRINQENSLKEKYLFRDRGHLQR